MVTCTGHIGIHEGADGRTDVYDVMAIKPNFLTSMGYHIFLTMVLRARAPSARAELRYKGVWDEWSGWCRKRQIDLLQASVTQVVEFLTDCYHEGKGYSSFAVDILFLNCFCPSLGHITQCPLGQ